MKKVLLVGFMISFLISLSGYVEAGKDLYPENYDLKEHKLRGYDCLRCHETMAELKPGNHDGAFIREHRSKTKRQVCSACHSTSFCIDCHYNTQKLSNVKGEQTGRILIHQGNWINLHGIRAQTNSFRCISCHDTSYCSDCHARSGIAAWNFTETTASIHPPGWRNKNSSNFHGKYARNNIVVCASCHDTKDKNKNPDCVTCHQFVNPHPSNWTDHDYDSATCQICHGNRSGEDVMMNSKRAKKAPYVLKK